ncbi:ABC transporter ATP-binding protein [Candidatus Jorgensenbacteria bacterium]|nr:ABC transporter ATP-binding protein [Candidatus Jorgensenbacteria bacterium]
MSLLWQYIKQYKKILFLALFLATINQIFSLLDPQIFRLIIDRYALRIDVLSQTEFVRGVILLLLATIGVAFVSRVAKNFQEYYVNVITRRVGAELYARSIAHSFSLPYSIFEDQRSGELLQTLQRARNDSQIFIVSAINIFFFSLVGIAFVISYAFIVNWTVGFLYLLIIPVLGFTTMMLSRRIKTAQKEIVAETADLAGSTTETIRNVELVKSLGLESQETNRLNNVNDEILKLELKKVRLIRTFSFIQGTIINGLRSLLMLLMLWLVFQKDITLGQFFSLLFYSFFIFNPLAEFGNVASQYQEARGSMEALQKIFDIPPAKKSENPTTLGSLANIKFKNVDFAYNRGPLKAVSDVNIELDAGTSIAFVGPSGSGKTTLVKLLVGLYEPTEGNLLINGIDTRSIDYDALRNRVGYVSQDTQLFAGTVRENLLFVNPKASDAECLKALGQASATSIIERTGKGLDTRIGESGIKVSGGERQRLAIARALLRNPELIIFDEATSSLDSLTEKSITETIQDIGKTRPGLMIIMVAHRLSTIAHADKIFVLEKGKIIEKGNHQTLLKKSGLYAALWREQSAESE